MRTFITERCGGWELLFGAVGQFDVRWLQLFLVGYVSPRGPLKPVVGLVICELVVHC